MPTRTKARILVVDDEPGVRESLGMLLVSAGYDVAVADDGVSAVSHLNTTVTDLIITDLNMPHMSGMELISHVRTRYPSISIVAMSGDYHGDAVPAGIVADRFYPKRAAPPQTVVNDREFDRKRPGAREYTRERIPAGAGFLDTRRNVCLEPF